MAKSMISKLVGMSFAAALITTAATAWAENVGDDAGGCVPYGLGPGMMRGGGAGMGPGMMGGGYGFEPGLMGGYGMGLGMMDGYGMGPGRHGYGALNRLDLSGEQRTKIDKIYDAERKRHWSVMGQIMDEQNKLRDEYRRETPDPKKIGAVYGAIAKLHQQMIETHVEAWNQAQKILTKEQREELDRLDRRSWGPRSPAGKP